jgi:methionyl-tRNA formyltransferase
LDLKKTIDGRLRTWLEALKPDILVVYMAPLLPPEIFMVPTFGTINMHPSLLPRYRGAHPILWMHLNMDQEGGVTIHRVDTGMDTGEILAQSAFHIPLGADEESVEHTAIDKLGVPLLKKVLMQFETGSVNALPQPAVKVSDSCKRLSHEEYRARLDWDNWSVTHMWHVLRCTRHWMAIYLPDKLRYRSGVWSIGAIEYGCNSLPYGVLEKDANGYYLNHRDGKIRLEYKASFEGFIKVWLKRVGNCCLHKQLAFGRSLELVPLTTAVVESLF